MAGLLGADLHDYEDINQLSIRSYTELLAQERDRDGELEHITPRRLRYSYHRDDVSWQGSTSEMEKDSEDGHRHGRRKESKRINARFEGVVKKDIVKWLVMFMIGVCTGSIAAAIGIVVEKLTELKVTPVAAGSGIPQIKCYLNGVKIPNVVAMKTLVCKVVGVTMSMAAGLAVGKEGPMIHSGAVVATGISQARSRRFKSLDFKVFKYFRCDTEKRDFVSAGAAAGVASAFGAPVGGVLFTLEEGASFWNQRLTWRIFFCSMVSTFTVNVLLSAVKGHPGELSSPGLISFGKFTALNYEWYELLVFMIMGVIGGLLGAFFNFINHRITVLRMRHMNKRLLKMLEAIVVCTITTVAIFLLIYFAEDCQPRDIFNGTDNGHPEKYQVQLRCREGEVDSMASLFFETPEGSVRRLFHDPDRAYRATSLALFCALYFALACWTYGLSVPSGIFIPSLLTGAAWGRLVGMLVNHSVPTRNFDIGKYALIGAAAQLGGILRMTISLTVILIEATGDMTFGLPVMLVLMTAQWTGNLFNQGLYDIHINLNGVPYLGWEAPPMSAKIFAREVMTAPVITLRTTEKVGDIVDLLIREIHNGFPVVENYSADEQIKGENYGRLKGLILRGQLAVLLRHKVFLDVPDMYNIPQEKIDEISRKLTLTDFRDAYPRYPNVEDIVVTDEEREMVMVLAPFMNPSPYSVCQWTSLPRIFRLFRALGLSYLMITDDDNKLKSLLDAK
ncbi:H(+)/Cl(-) exchange transporter 7-like [Glandiceps talaboti]